MSHIVIEQLRQTQIAVAVGYVVRLVAQGLLLAYDGQGIGLLTRMKWDMPMLIVWLKLRSKL